MKLSDLSIKRPVMAVVVSLLLVVLGAMSFMRLTLRELPNIDPPIVSVDVTYPGASAAAFFPEAASANRSITGLERPLGDFATTSLPQLTGTIEELQDATRSLQSLIDDVRASPRDFIGRPKSKELEVQP